MPWRLAIGSLTHIRRGGGGGNIDVAGEGHVEKHFFSRSVIVA